MNYLKKLIPGLFVFVFAISVFAQSSSFDVDIPDFNCLYEPGITWDFLYPDGWQITEQDEMIMLNSPAITDLEPDTPIPDGEIQLTIDPAYQDRDYTDVIDAIYSDYGLDVSYDAIENDLEGEYPGFYLLEFHPAEITGRVNDLTIVYTLIIVPAGLPDLDTFIYEVAPGTAADFADFTEAFVSGILETYDDVETDCVTSSPATDDEVAGAGTYIAAENVHLVEKDYQRTIYSQWADFLPTQETLFNLQNGDIQVIDALSLEENEVIGRDEIATESVRSLDRFWIDDTGSQLAYTSLNTLVLWNRDDDSLLELASNSERYGRTIIRDSVRFSPDGNTLAYLSNTPEILILDTASGQQLATFPVDEIEAGFRSLVFYPDGTYLFGFLGNRVYIWDMTTYTEVQVIRQSGDNIHGWDMSSDGRFLAWADWSYVWLWDWNAGSPIQIGLSQQPPNVILSQHLSPVSLDATGQYLAYASAGNNVFVVDTGTREAVASFTGHEAKIVDVQFNTVGTILATFSEDNILNFQDISRDTLLHSIDTDLYRRRFTHFDFMEFGGVGSYLLLAGNGFIHKYGFPGGVDIPMPESGIGVSDTDDETVQSLSYDASVDDMVTTETGDRWVFNGTEGEIVTITMRSSEFDTTLTLLDTSGENLLYNDDANFATTDSSITIELPASSEFTIVAGTLDGTTGAYTIAIGPADADTSLTTDNNTALVTQDNTPVTSVADTGASSESDNDTTSPSPAPTTAPEIANVAPTATLVVPATEIAVINCPGTLVSHMILNVRGRVVVDGGNLSNRMRSGAGTNFAEVDRIPPGGEFDVLDGPVCSQGYAWWQVNYNGLIGWTAEADNTRYWIEPIENTTIQQPTDAECIASTNGQTNLRQGPGTNFERATTVSANTQFTVIGQDLNPGGFTWFELENGYWVREDVVTLQGDCTNLQ